MPTLMTERSAETLASALLPELEQEAKMTRLCLERIPEAAFPWNPHPRAMTLGALAAFLAVLPGWVRTTITQDSLDLEEATTLPRHPKSRDEILGLFDRNLVDARAVLASASDQTLLEPWTLLRGGKRILEQSRAVVLRFFVLNHLVHHRGQLTVYLRMHDIPVPALYGPSGDEGHW